MQVFLRYYHSDELNDAMAPILGAVSALQKLSRGFLSRRRVKKMFEIKAQEAAKVASLISTAQGNGDLSYDVVMHQVKEDSGRTWEKKPEPKLMSRDKVTGSVGKASGMKRAASVRWFKEVEKKKGNGMADGGNAEGVGGFAQWFHGVISRYESESLLGAQGVGAFLIRVSESRFGYSLSVKTPQRIKHFMVDQGEDGMYIVVGNDRRFASLNDMVAHHLSSPLTEEGDRLLKPCPQKESNLAELMD